MAGATVHGARQPSGDLPQMRPTDGGLMSSPRAGAYVPCTPLPRRVPSVQIQRLTVTLDLPAIRPVDITDLERLG